MRACVVGSMVLLVALVWPSRGSACSCGAFTIWNSQPDADATDVPIDFAPVIEGVFDPASLRFQDASGQALGLGVVDRLPVGDYSEGVELVVWAKAPANAKWVGLGLDVHHTSVDGILGAGGISAEFDEDDLGGTAFRIRIMVGR